MTIISSIAGSADTHGVIATDLRNAAEVLKNRPWRRGDVDCCVVGAIIIAVDGIARLSDAARGALRIWDAERALTAYLVNHGLGDDALTWNDTKCTTGTQAQRTLRAAADWWINERPM